MKNLTLILIGAILLSSCTKEVENSQVKEEVTKGRKPPPPPPNNIPAPTGLKVVRTDSAQLTISWNALSGATSYWVYRSDLGGSPIAIVTTTKFIDNYANKAYSYAVAAVVNSQLGTKSLYMNEFAPSQETIQSTTTQRVSRDGFVHVGVESSWATNPAPPDNNKGVSFAAVVKKLAMNGDYTKSTWAALMLRYLKDGVWYRVWIQFGWYYLQGDRYPNFAFYVYYLSPNYGQAGDLDIKYTGANAMLFEGQLTRFEFKNTEGTRWSMSLNDIKIFDVDLYSDVASNFPPEVSSNNAVEYYTEARGGNTFSTVIHVNYLDYFKEGNWYHVPSARYNISTVLINSSGWFVGVKPGYKTSEFDIGGNGGGLQPGTLIW